MVYLIVWLILVQNFATIILESVFLCDFDPGASTIDFDYFFEYSLIQQIANLQIYVTLIWTQNWLKAALNLEMEFGLNVIAE